MNFAAMPLPDCPTFFRSIPDPAKVAADDDIVILCHLLLLREIRCIESVEFRMRIAGNIYHYSLSLPDISIYVKHRLSSRDFAIISFLNCIPVYILNVRQYSVFDELTKVYRRVFALVGRKI